MNFFLNYMILLRIFLFKVWSVRASPPVRARHASRSGPQIMSAHSHSQLRGLNMSARAHWSAAPRAQPQPHSSCSSSSTSCHASLSSRPCTTPPSWLRARHHSNVNISFHFFSHGKHSRGQELQVEKYIIIIIFYFLPGDVT